MRDKIIWPRVPAPDWPVHYLQIRWAWAGRDPALGLDCYGLLVCAYRDRFGISIPDMADQQTAHSDKARTRQAARLLAKRDNFWVPIDRPVPGAAILMRTGSLENHCGIALGGGDFLHACEKLGRTARERLSDHRAIIAGYFLPAPVLSAKAAL